MRFLLDTNVVSEPIAKAPNSRVVTRLQMHAEQCGIAAPVWHELVFGCRRMPRGKRRGALDSYLHDVVQASFPILPYDEAAAALHGIERARLELAGRPIPFVDGQIAAIAKLHGLTLVTRNVRYFKAFKDLELIDWSSRLPG